MTVEVVPAVGHDSEYAMDADGRQQTGDPAPHNLMVATPGIRIMAMGGLIATIGAIS
jgi:hypothetical protein